MKFCKILSAGVLTGMALAMAGISTPALAQQYTIQSEEARHPGMVRAIHELEAALRTVETSPDDFGGRKEQAIRDMRAAIHSLKSALYYRLQLDDAGLERIP